MRLKELWCLIASHHVISDDNYINGKLILDFKCSRCDKRMVQDMYGKWSVVGDRLGK